MLDQMATKKKTAAEPSTAVVRVPTALLDRAASVGEAMAARIGGTELPLAYVVRTALERGLDAIEADLKRK